MKINLANEDVFGLKEEVKHNPHLRNLVNSDREQDLMDAIVKYYVFTEEQMKEALKFQAKMRIFSKIIKESA